MMAPTLYTYLPLPWNRPDLAVGAPESDAVVFLSTRLIVNAWVRIAALANPLAKRNADCPPGGAGEGGAAVLVSGCLRLALCINFTVSDAGFNAGAAAAAFDSLRE